MRIAVAMSGGVDSSFAALSLKNEGHEVTGITAWLWRCGSPRLADSACCGSVEGLKHARAAAEAVGIEHRVVDLSAEFEECVVEETARAYASGLTPNPCVVCNSRVRFPHLARAAREMGAEALATGHYARLLPSDGGGVRLPVRLYRGRDPDHDQSYFLFAVAPDDLAFARFPLGDVTKAEVRERMACEGHPAAQTPSSQDLCFLALDGPEGANDMTSLVRSRGPEGLEPGDVVYLDGRAIGRHRGLAHYTVGQRRGIGVAWTQALYVIELRPETNELVVGPDEALLRSDFSVEDVRWLAPGIAPDDEEPIECLVQIRYRMKAAPARVKTESGGRARVELGQPVRAVAPGQAAVFYAETPEGDMVLGGGWIAREA